MSSVNTLFERGLLWSGNSTTATLGGRQRSVATFGIPAIDSLLPCVGLPFGHVHEWVLDTELGLERKQWYPPLCIITSLVASAVFSSNDLSSSSTLSPVDAQRVKNKCLVWIGRKAWPTPHLLEHTFRAYTHSADFVARDFWRSNSIFIDPFDTKKRLWCILQALRSPAVGAVIADGSSLNIAALRRIQLAAEEGNALGILLRPPWEQQSPSFAYSRWLVAPETLPHLLLDPISKDSGFISNNYQAEQLCWRLVLDRLKGTVRTDENMRTGTTGTREWLIAWNKEQYYGNGSLCLAASLTGGTQQNAAHRAVA